MASFSLQSGKYAATYKIQLGGRGPAGPTAELTEAAILAEIGTAGRIKAELMPDAITMTSGLDPNATEITGEYVGQQLRTGVSPTFDVWIWSGEIWYPIKRTVLLTQAEYLALTVEMQNNPAVDYYITD
jgi:hypothetical protein